MNEEKVKVRMQPANERVNNFNEVELGYNDEEALKEASRCLNCKIPKCVEGCPVNIMIPNFIKAIKDGDNKLAYEIINNDSKINMYKGRKY